MGKVLMPTRVGMENYMVTKKVPTEDMAEALLSILCIMKRN
jgi:hypothetical protein